MSEQPYMKRNAASGFWPVRTPQEKYGPRRPGPDCCTDARDGDPWTTWVWHDHPPLSPTEQPRDESETP